MKTLMSLLSFLFFLPFGQSRHIIGGEMTYACLGNGNYKVSMQLYRDCGGSGSNFKDLANIAVYSKNGANYQLYSQEDVALSDRQWLSVPDGPCEVMTASPCIEVGRYDMEINLPSGNGEYLIVYQRCCRNNTINNIPDPENTGLTLSLAITSAALAVCNNSPVFKEYSRSFVCVNEDLNLFNAKAEDPDGDQLIYEFCAPLNGGGTQGSPDNPGDPNGCEGVIPNPACPPPFTKVAFIEPEYSETEPLGGDPVIQIDANTGSVFGRPHFIGQYAYGVCVSEYRNGVLLSTVRRDFQVNITSCMGEDPTFLFSRIENDTLVIYTCGETLWQLGIENLDVDRVGDFYWEVDVQNDGNYVTSTDWAPSFSFPGPDIYSVRLHLYGGLACERTIPIKINTIEEDCLILSHSDLEKEQLLLFYPNPVQDVLHIKRNQAQSGGTLSFRILDCRGKIMDQFTSRGDWAVATSGWSEGIYFIQYGAAGHWEETQRFLILR